MIVAELMRRSVVTVPTTMPIKDLARLFVEQDISGAPVVDGSGRIEGVVSVGDIVNKERGVVPRSGQRLEWLFGEEADSSKRTARTAGEAMSRPAVTIGPTSSAAEAARMMVMHGVNRLPVLEDERLVGIVTRSDLLRAFARSDEEVSREIRGDVLLHTLWLQPQTLDVRVQDGQVTLAGIVETRTDAELAAAYVARVPGVVSVDSSGLVFRRDDLLRRRGRWPEQHGRRRFLSVAASEGGSVVRDSMIGAGPESRCSARG
jgi:CBS domain-containing protein